MIDFDKVNFSKRRTEELMFLLTLSVFVEKVLSHISMVWKLPLNI